MVCACIQFFLKRLYPCRCPYCISNRGSREEFEKKRAEKYDLEPTPFPKQDYPVSDLPFSMGKKERCLRVNVSDYKVDESTEESRRGSRRESKKKPTRNKSEPIFNPEEDFEIL